MRLKIEVYKIRLDIRKITQKKSPITRGDRTSSCLHVRRFDRESRTVGIVYLHSTPEVDVLGPKRPELRRLHAPGAVPTIYDPVNSILGIGDLALIPAR